jgi:hypothetical protein
MSFLPPPPSLAPMVTCRKYLFCMIYLTTLLISQFRRLPLSLSLSLSLYIYIYIYIYKTSYKRLGKAYAFQNPLRVKIMQETDRNHPKSSKSKYTCKLDKKKLCTGSIRVLSAVVATPTTIQISNCRFGVANKLSHNMLQKPVLTHVLCISCISMIHFSKVMKRVWCP